MNFRNKHRWSIILTYCIGWTLAFIFLSIVRGIGATEDGAFDLTFNESLLYSFMIGPFFGAISGFAQIYIFERIYKRASARKLLFIRVLLSLAFIFILIIASYLIIPLSFNVEISFLEFIIDEGSFPIYFYVFCVDVFMGALSQINLMLGGNNLWKILRGRFYIPHEENRIFMFLDLQSSTEYAERLGHIEYSMLIRDCFNDLGVVIENEAEIYQYVGDEAILTWKLRDGLRNQNCINAFFNFKKQLLKKEAYYKEKYNVVPFFKAGLNDGVVVATEVGKYKKEIAYHGDTINTAARIQGKCNEFQQELLLSESLKNKLNPTGIEFELLGNIQLRGKRADVHIYTAFK
ncbi:adenylate/guanylate cyclase domain-containing protein [uncultured Dokdonia sp.]|uniref:adenylate/guanylate cyclase domain-containing protein n=1 Tax=uncultured Dokdonia sp. TaxID=575653 RepID=UPI002611263A|nr:adenylate/guanylate cyclase domain-containing protein [uncultured Dokdonia sp.]